jgi:hypothetical protein
VRNLEPSPKKVCTIWNLRPKRCAQFGAFAQKGVRNLEPLPKRVEKYAKGVRNLEPVDFSKRLTAA